MAFTRILGYPRYRLLRPRLLVGHAQFFDVGCKLISVNPLFMR